MTTQHYKETAIPRGENGPFGIISSPVHSQRDTGFILLNSGLLHRVGPSRLYVNLCRELAKLGFVAARIDISGKGDTPRRRNVEATESLLLDYDLCCQALQKQTSISQFIVVGLCSGADDALTIAVRRVNVAGIVMLDGYAARTLRYFQRHYSSRFFRIEPWKRIPRRIFTRVMRIIGNKAVAQGQLRMRDVRNFPSINAARTNFESMSTHLESCLCVYTSASRSYYNYKGQLQEKFATLVPSRGLQEEYLPFSKHTYPLAHHRKRVVDIICKWSDSFK